MDWLEQFSSGWNAKDIAKLKGLAARRTTAATIGILMKRSESEILSMATELGIALAQNESRNYQFDMNIPDRQESRN